MRIFTKLMLTSVLLVLAVGGAKARTVKALGSPITFEQALATSDPFVLVQDGAVICCFQSPGWPNDYVTFKPVSDIDDYAYTIGFEKDGETDNYFIKFYNQAPTPSLLGYINASQYSHSFMASEGNSKNAQKGNDGTNGALWTITEVGTGTKQYAIRNVGVAGGTIGTIATSKGYLKVIPSGYWVDHVTIDNETGPTCQFYTLTTTTTPDLDPVYFGWEDFEVDGNATKDNENHLVIDTREYAPYWAISGTWTFATPFDASNYRYLVFYAKRNITKYGNGDNETGGSLLIIDDSGVTMRQDDYTKFNDVNYPGVPSGSFWMNRWGAQRAMVLDLQWLANTDKYGNGSECKSIDIAKIKKVGVAGTFTIGGIFFTNTLPANIAGDYKRSFDSFDKFGTVCLPYSAVCCGAQLYEVTGKTASGITLSEYDGVIEAGKPYFYKTLEAIKQDNGFKNEDNVYFFKAGYATATAGTNNGLVGTFTGIDPLAPNDNYYVLSNNALYKVDADATDEKAVKVGANKAYIDMSKVPASAPGLGTITLDVFGGTTGISQIENGKVRLESVYNLAGQRVAQPTKGLYIVNGKKVIIK